jgi:signal transduction histidine kinase
MRHPLRTFSALLSFAILVNLQGVKGQGPDVSKIPAYGDKIKAWVGYCDSLQAAASGDPGNFGLLTQAAVKAIQTTSPDDAPNRIRFYQFAAIANYSQIKFDSAQYFFYQCLHEAQKAHLPKEIVRVCTSLIPVNYQLQQMDKVEECKNLLQSIVDTTKDRENLENGYFALGSYYQDKSYYSTAQDFFIKGIQLREKELDTTQDVQKKFAFAIQCDLLSKLYLNTQMTDKSLAALRKGQRFAAISPIVGNRLASSFIEAFTTSGNIDSALYYDRQLEANVTNPLQFSSEIVSSDLNIAIYYIDHQQYSKALPYITKSDTLAAQTKSPVLIFQVQMARGRFLEETGKFDPAIILLSQSLPVAKQLDKELYGNDLKYMALAQKGKGNVNGSLQYYQQYVETMDSLNKEKMSRTFADLETHYQTNEKEQRIAILDKENRLNVLELENASRTRLVLVLGLVALGVISLLLYFIYRNKEKLNKVLNERNDQLDIANRHLGEANETKARLFGIISHDLRSPVSKIVSLLQLQKQRPDLFNEESRERHGEKLKKASENVLETMEDLLLWSKSQMQNFTPEFRPVKVADTVQKEISLLQEQLDEKGVGIDFQVPESFIEHTDENFLSVIIRNLLQNAVKYSDGEKMITVSATGQQLVITNTTSKATAGALNDRLRDTHVDSKASGLGLQIAADLAARIYTRLSFREEAGSTLTAVLSWDASSQ